MKIQVLILSSERRKQIYAVARVNPVLPISYDQINLFGEKLASNKLISYYFM